MHIMGKVTTRKLSKEELVAMARKEIEAKKAAKAAGSFTNETKAVEPAVKTPTEQPEKAKEPKKTEAPIIVNIAEIRGKLPPRVTTKDLCVAFGYTDGGKTLRKVLRSKFAAPSNHEKKADWSWNKEDKVLDEILTYFAKATKTAVVAAQ